MRLATGIALALLGLHALTVFPYPWEDVSLARSWLSPSPDLAALLGLACALVLVAGAPRRVAHACAPIVLFVPLYRFGVTLMPVFYGREFEPYVDVLETPALLHLLLHRHAPSGQVLLVATVVVAGVLLYWLTYRMLLAVARPCARPRFALGLLLVLQGIAVGDWLARDVDPQRAGRVWRDGMLAACLADVADIVRKRSWRVAATFRERAAAASQELTRTPQDLEVLAGADVYFLFLESYGRGILGNRARPVYERWLVELAARLRAYGLAACSNWIQPSVRGGGSAMAHAELMSGMRIEDRGMFDQLLASSTTVLPAIFRGRGYHTVDVQPAMPREWPEAEMLGYESNLFRSAFAYTGRTYHWGDMPDQFALQHVLASVVRHASEPLFLQFVSVTGHSPFSMIPPYYDDWSKAAEADAFAGEPAERHEISWTNYATHPGIEKAYLASMRYSLTTAVGFACELERPSLVFIAGDHQPPLVYEDLPERVFDVPIHALSNNPDLLGRLVGQGWKPGLAPDFDGQGFKSVRFLYRFLQAFSRPDK